MRIFIVAAILTALVGCSKTPDEIERDLIRSLLSQSVQASLVAKVPELQWVEVKNPDMIQNGNENFVWNNSCTIEHGATLTQIGNLGRRVLVRYAIDSQQFGASCPSGILFFIPQAEFSGMTALYEKIVREEKAEFESVWKMVSDPISNPATLEVSRWRWVDAKNPGGPRHARCGIESGGTLTEIGSLGNQTLVRYTVSGNASGAGCKDQTLCFVPSDEFRNGTLFSLPSDRQP